ncbi:MAG: polysaccharide deacetylase family protein [Candidatus Omnitrophica bacterium]|nr:polysaccharide deacetylase family protein [Candidatus Omnitrophota bacterium]
MTFWTLASVFAGGALALWAAEKYRPTPILLYHFIDGEHEKSVLSVSLSSFHRQILHLLKNYRIVSLEEFLAAKREGRALSEKSVVITFDDGDDAFYTKVYPFLLRFKVPAALFIITDWVGRAGYLTWDQIRSMSNEIVTIGSHTVTHRYLPDLSLDDVRQEFVESKRILEHETGRPVRFLSYPVGGFGTDIARLAREAGYAAALTTNRGRNMMQKDLYALKRIKMTESSVSWHSLSAKLSGYYQIFAELFPKEPGSKAPRKYPA